MNPPKKFQEHDPVVHAEQVRTWSDLYAGEHYTASHPLISPLHANLHGLPPVFIQASTREVLTDDALRLAEHIEAAGGEVQLDMWEDMIHVWQLFWRMLPESDEAVRRIAAFVRERMQVGGGIVSQLVNEEVGE